MFSMTGISGTCCLPGLLNLQITSGWLACLLNLVVTKDYCFFQTHSLNKNQSADKQEFEGAESSAI